MTPGASDAFEEVRTGLSNGLRALNEQLQRFTERMERQDAAADAPPVPPTESAATSGATMPEASGIVTSDSAPPATTSSPVARSPKPPRYPQDEISPRPPKARRRFAAVTPQPQALHSATRTGACRVAPVTQTGHNS
ncbi:MAG: hypothetical protein U0841_33950 [Chloroflexia bacterium]